MGLLDFFTGPTAQRVSMGLEALTPEGRNFQRQRMMDARNAALQDEELAYTRKQRGLLDQQMERERADEGLLSRLVGMPIEQDMGGQMGPGAPMPNPGVDPRTFLAQGGSLGGLGKVQGVNQMLIPPVQKPEYKVVDGALVKIDGGGVSEAYRAPAKPEKVDPNKPFMLDANGNIVPNEAYQAYDLRARRAGATNVSVGAGQKDANWGSPPKDYVWARDGSGNVKTERDEATGAFRPIALPIGGSKDAAEREAAAGKDGVRQRTLSQQADSVLDTIREAKDKVGLTTAGAGGLMASVPMTDARRLSGLITTIKANLGFDRLQQMRDMSPTGGALGQVAVQELQSLQSTVALLDQLQSPSDVRKALEKIEGHYMRWKETLGGSTGGASGDFGPPRVNSQAEAMALPPGTRFIDPNGVERIR